MSNPRKGKVPYTLWLTAEEDKEIVRSLNGDYILSVGEVVRSANKRGDFEKR